MAHWEDDMGLKMEKIHQLLYPLDILLLSVRETQLKISTSAHSTAGISIKNFVGFNQIIEIGPTLAIKVWQVGQKLANGQIAVHIRFDN